MKCMEFCYWLKGYFVLSNNQDLRTEQLTIINKTLNEVLAQDEKANAFCVELKCTIDYLDVISLPSDFTPRLIHRLDIFIANLENPISIAPPPRKSQVEILC